MEKIESGQKVSAFTRRIVVVAANAEDRKVHRDKLTQKIDSVFGKDLELYGTAAKAVPTKDLERLEEGGSCGSVVVEEIPRQQYSITVILVFG